MLRAVLLAALLAASAAHVIRDAVRDEDADRYRVPDGILWGAGVSAWQTEGAYHSYSKVESAIDHLILKDEHPMDYESDHMVAADSFHRFKEDVAAAAKLKLKIYKFSVSWARLMPWAEPWLADPGAVLFYHLLIDEIVANGMTPVMTMYHFDHPQILEDRFMGWQSRDMVQKFADYSEFIFTEYGMKVSTFVTFNEPNVYCTRIAAQYVAAGFRTEDQVDPYQCIHNTILAHQAAYQIYQSAKKTYKWDGKVGFSTLLMPTNPASGAPEDVNAADIVNQLHAGTSLHPIVFGDYPQSIKTLLGNKLPEFTDNEKVALADSTDFIGLNVYFSLSASYNENSTSGGVASELLGQMAKDIPFIDVAVDLPAGSSHLNVAMAASATINPSTMRDALLWTWKSFNKPIFITENGYSDVLGLGTHDTQRAAYHSASLRSLVTTVKDHGVQVLGYSAWSLIDTFDVSGNYSRPFGLVHVDYEGGSLNRTLKDSSEFWIQLGETGVVPLVANPDDATTAAPTTSATAPTTAC